jgi:DNA repair protein RecO (recombination protein O)
VVCERCGPQARGAVPVPSRVVNALWGLQRGDRVPLPPEIRQRARQLLNLFIAHHLGRKLKSVDFMDQVGLD